MGTAVFLKRDSSEGAVFGTATAFVRPQEPHRLIIHGDDESFQISRSSRRTAEPLLLSPFLLLHCRQKCGPTEKCGLIGSGRTRSESGEIRDPMGEKIETSWERIGGQPSCNHGCAGGLALIVRGLFLAPPPSAIAPAKVSQVYVVCL